LMTEKEDTETSTGRGKKGRVGVENGRNFNVKNPHAKRRRNGKDTGGGGKYVKKKKRQRQRGENGFSDVQRTSDPAAKKLYGRGERKKTLEESILRGRGVREKNLASSKKDFILQTGCAYIPNVAARAASNP